jgi:uncharacterized protein YjbI with pentapeptide repeats
MANPDHLEMLRQGVDAWNAWREPGVAPDLSAAHLIEANLRGANLCAADLRGAYLNRAKLMEAYLREADLSHANLSQADLYNANLIDANLSKAGLIGADIREANLSGANLIGANLSRANLCGASLLLAHLSRAHFNGAFFVGAHLIGADLRQADLSGASLSGADLRQADLRGAKLGDADLSGANLHQANLSGANLTRANLAVVNLVDADMTNADLTGCHIYGVSAWGLKLSDKTRQRDLIITKEDEPEVTVDNIEVAQFVYLLLNNQKIRDVIDTITSKAVLLLGRFTTERKAVLDALRDELRKRDYLPILFDFEGPESRDITETVSLLARMARFIIADLTDPSSIPKELEAIVPSVPVPVQPLLEGLARPYAMFKDYWKYDWVLPPHRYEGLNTLLSTLAGRVIAPAEAKVKALEERRRAIEAELTTPRT